MCWRSELTFRFGTRTETAPAGSFVFVPGGSEALHLERAALERAQSSAEAGQYSSLDAETLSALARKYGIEFVD